MIINRQSFKGEGILKNKLLSDSIVYIISPIILLAFTNYSTIIYFASALVFILSIYTIITKKGNRELM